MEPDERHYATSEELKRRVEALEEWKHGVEKEAIKKMAEMSSHHDRFSDAIEMLASSHKEIEKKVSKIEELLRQVRTAILSVFMTAVLLVGFFSLGPIEFFKTILSK